MSLSWLLLTSSSAPTTSNPSVPSPGTLLTIKCRRIPHNTFPTHILTKLQENDANYDIFSKLGQYAPVSSIKFSYQRARLRDFEESISKHLKGFIGKEGSKLLLRAAPHEDSMDTSDSDDTPADFMEIHVQSEPKESHLDLIARNKMKGNDAFKMKEWGDAIKHYKAGIWLSKREESNTADAHQLELQCRSNLSQIYIFVEKPKKAVEECTKVLENDPDNVKVLFRRATARKMLQEYEEAANDLEHAMRVEPQNDLWKKELARVKKMQRDLSERSKKMFKGMFA